MNISSDSTSSPNDNSNNKSQCLGSGLHICLHNCRSLSNKLTEFQAFVYSSDYGIISLAETWLSDFIFDHEILPTGYIYRADGATRGGGVYLP